MVTLRTVSFIGCPFMLVLKQKCRGTVCVKYNIQEKNIHNSAITSTLSGKIKPDFDTVNLFL